MVAVVAMITGVGIPEDSACLTSLLVRSLNLLGDINRGPLMLGSTGDGKKTLWGFLSTSRTNPELAFESAQKQGFPSLNGVKLVDSSPERGS